MSTGPQEAAENRDLLARLDRENERIRDENEWLSAHEKRDEFLRDAEQELRQTMGASLPASLVRWILPANADPLAPQNPQRRVEFRERLAGLLDAAARLDRASLTDDRPPSATGPRETVAAGACIACRGSCCRSGGDHAYLTEETFALYRQDHPELSAAQVLEAYVSRIPAESYVDSCIYHSATGCGLSRDMRSSTCNRHECGKLIALRAALPEQAPPPVLAVLVDDGRWTRTALIDAAGVRILSDAP